MIAAAGNEEAVAGSAIIRHRWVIPVVAYGRSGQLLPQSSLGRSIGIGDLGGPGEGVVSLAAEGATGTGTGIVAPFVTGAAALLWSMVLEAGAAEVKECSAFAAGGRRTVIPPLLDAWTAYEVLSEGRTEEDRAMRKDEPEAAASDRPGPAPHRVRIPGFNAESEVGLGDVIKRATSLAGIRPCGSRSARAASFNRWLVFSRRR